jgi:hypothetical protein
MTEQQKSANAMLGAAANHMLRAGELTQQARAQQCHGSHELYWYTIQRVAEELVLVNHCFHEAHTILLGELGIELPPTIQALNPRGMVQ